MYVVVQHRITDPQTAFARGERLIKNEGHRPGCRGCSSTRAGTAPR